MSYVEDFRPSEGVSTPRAALRSDAPQLRLDGWWRLRWSARIADADDFHDPDLDDSGWDAVAVPSSLPLHGFGSPWYTNTAYPFPIDPPFVPPDNPTADHGSTSPTSTAGAPAGTSTSIRRAGIRSRTVLAHSTNTEPRAVSWS
jgi:beta-galactosidase